MFYINIINTHCNYSLCPISGCFEGISLCGFKQLSVHLCRQSTCWHLTCYLVSWFITICPCIASSKLMNFEINKHEKACKSEVRCMRVSVKVKCEIVSITCHWGEDLWWRYWAQKNWPMHTALYCLPGHQYSEIKHIDIITLFNIMLKIEEISSFLKECQWQHSLAKHRIYFNILTNNLLVLFFSQY